MRRETLRGRRRRREAAATRRGSGGGGGCLAEGKEKNAFINKMREIGGRTGDMNFLRPSLVLRYEDAAGSIYHG